MTRLEQFNDALLALARSLWIAVLLFTIAALFPPFALASMNAGLLGLVAQWSVLTAFISTIIVVGWTR